jgi:hypothetical protein
MAAASPAPLCGKIHSGEGSRGVDAPREPLCPATQDSYGDHPDDLVTAEGVGTLGAETPHGGVLKRRPRPPSWKRRKLAKKLVQGMAEGGIAPGFKVESGIGVSQREEGNPEGADRLGKSLHAGGPLK